MKLHDIVNEFIDLTIPNVIKSTIQTEVGHCIITTCQPIAELLRRYAGEKLQAPTKISLSEIQQHQQQDQELQQYLKNQTCLNLQKLVLQENIQIFCDTSTNRIRPYIPSTLRMRIFNIVHNLSHPRTRATLKKIQQKYVWPSMNSDITKWVRICAKCQIPKINKRNQLPPKSFHEVDQRFEHVHIDIMVMPEVKGYRYCLTMLDRFTRWPEF